MLPPFSERTEEREPARSLSDGTERWASASSLSEGTVRRSGLCGGRGHTCATCSSSWGRRLYDDRPRNLSTDCGDVSVRAERADPKLDLEGDASGSACRYPAVRRHVVGVQSAVSFET